MVKFHLYLTISEDDRDCILAEIKRNPSYFDLGPGSLSFGVINRLENAVELEDVAARTMITYFYKKLGNPAKEQYLEVGSDSTEFYNQVANLDKDEPPQFFVYAKSLPMGPLRPIYDPIDLTLPETDEDLIEEDETSFDSTFDETFE